jgi:hypothetical protein
MNKGLMQMERATIEMHRAMRVPITGNPDIEALEIDGPERIRFIRKRPRRAEVDVVADLKREMQMACKKKGKGRGK